MPLINSQYFAGRYCERYDARVRRPDVAFAQINAEVKNLWIIGVVVGHGPWRMTPAAFGAVQGEIRTADWEHYS